MSNKAAKDQEQKGAEAKVEAFEKELGPFVIATKATRMAMAFTDAREADHPIIFANNAFLKLLGYDRDEVLAQSFNFILAAGADEEAVCEVEAAFSSPFREEPEIHYRRRDGTECWATLLVAPVEDEQGAVAQHFLSLVDTTEFKKAEQHAASLIDELNHRVKNTLTTVQSIVSQAVRNAQDPQAVRESIETRIAALSRAHDLLGREEWNGVSLNDLVCEVLAPFMASDLSARRFTIEGENIRLLPKATLALGIAFNELAANAAKYGAFSNETGKIAIEWAMEEKPDGRWLCIHWRETGGPQVTVPEHHGFGSRVIKQGLAHELAGVIKWDLPPTGVVYDACIPASHAIHDG